MSTTQTFNYCGFLGEDEEETVTSSTSLQYASGSLSGGRKVLYIRDRLAQDLYRLFDEVDRCFPEAGFPPRCKWWDNSLLARQWFLKLADKLHENGIVRKFEDRNLEERLKAAEARIKELEGMTGKLVDFEPDWEELGQSILDYSAKYAHDLFTSPRNWADRVAQMIQDHYITLRSTPELEDLLDSVDQR